MPLSVCRFDSYSVDQAGDSAGHQNYFFSVKKQACGKYYIFLVIKTPINIDFVQWKLKLFVRLNEE